MITEELWRVDEIAEYLKVAKKTVQNKVLNAPSFPPPRLLPFEHNKRPAKRWIPKEVITWATRHSS